MAGPAALQKQRLNQVVVGPGVEAANFVVGFARGGEYQNWHARVVGTHLAAYFQTVEAEQRLVQNQAIMLRQ
jgi:hypothetical protein